MAHPLTVIQKFFVNLYKKVTPTELGPNHPLKYHSEQTMIWAELIARIEHDPIPTTYDQAASYLMQFTPTKLATIIDRISASDCLDVYEIPSSLLDKTREHAKKTVVNLDQ